MLQFFVQNFSVDFVELRINVGDRHLDNILGKEIIIITTELINNSIQMCLFYLPHSWFDYGWNFTHRLQCVLWEGQIIASAGESAIPHDSQSTRGAWRYRHRGKLFFPFVYVNYVHFVPRRIPRNFPKHYGRKSVVRLLCLLRVWFFRTKTVCLPVVW